MTVPFVCVHKLLLKQTIHSRNLSQGLAYLDVGYVWNKLSDLMVVAK
jgi:hypothetical protein